MLLASAVVWVEQKMLVALKPYCCCRYCCSGVLSR